MLIKEPLPIRTPVIPHLSRRILLFVCAAAAGGLVGSLYSFPVTFRGGTLVIFPLSFLAGISVLWSP